MTLTPWTVADVARALRVGRSTVYDLCRRGRLRYARIGRQLRFAPAWVEEYLTSVTAGPAVKA